MLFTLVSPGCLEHLHLYVYQISDDPDLVVLLPSEASKGRTVNRISYILILYPWSNAVSNTGTNLEYDSCDQCEKVITLKRLFEKTYENLNSSVKSSFLVLVPDTAVNSKRTKDYKPPDKSTL